MCLWWEARVAVRGLVSVVWKGRPTAFFGKPLGTHMLETCIQWFSTCMWKSGDGNVSEDSDFLQQQKSAIYKHSGLSSIS